MKYNFERFRIKYCLSGKWIVRVSKVAEQGYESIQDAMEQVNKINNMSFARAIEYLGLSLSEYKSNQSGDRNNPRTTLKHVEFSMQLSMIDENYTETDQTMYIYIEKWTKAQHYNNNTN